MSQWLHEMKPFNFHTGRKKQVERGRGWGQSEYIKHVSFRSSSIIVFKLHTDKFTAWYMARQNIVTSSLIRFFLGERKSFVYGIHSIYPIYVLECLKLLYVCFICDKIYIHIESDIVAIACVLCRLCVWDKTRPNLNAAEKAYFYGAEFPFQSPKCVDINQ